MSEAEGIYKELEAQIEFLRCPITKSKLRVEGDVLVSELENIRYPINDGIPVLLADLAIAPEGQNLDEIKTRYA